jgi:hypothetical protein
MRREEKRREGRGGIEKKEAKRRMGDRVRVSERMIGSDQTDQIRSVTACGIQEPIRSPQAFIHFEVVCKMGAMCMLCIMVVIKSLKTRCCSLH